jgi:predicted nuclease of predicted toxin-antitoxin system
LSVEFLADESVDFRIITYLRAKNIPILPVRDQLRGSTDKRILELSRETKRILITEDKDFGEWVFAHREQAPGVLFLRYKNERVNEMSATLAQFIVERGDSLKSRFATLTPDKVRIRAI